MRTLGILGLHELLHTLDRHEQKLGVKREDPDIDFNTRSALQATWERTESARIEIRNGHPHMNAQALLSLVSALDAMVEDMVRSFRGFRVKPSVDDLMSRAGAKVPESVAALDTDAMGALNEVLTETIARKALGRGERLYGCGPDRYERVLAQIGFAAPDDRPLPEGLVKAITEASALRDVLMHRAGRVDLRALKDAPTLPYKRGQLVRVSRNDYRRYSAAVRCYAHEIAFRGIRNWPDVTDQANGPDLERWDQYYVLGT